MKHEGDEALLLARALDVARKARPPTLSDDDASEMVRRAARIARTTEPRSLAWPISFGLAAVAAAAAAVLAVALSSGDGSVRSAAVPAEPMELALPTGDRLTALEGSVFELASVTREMRRVELSRGSMVFDVAPLGGGTRFEVETPELTVRVLGTVFSVEVEPGETTVRVFEGRVEVVQGGDVRVLEAGERIATADGDDAREADPRIEEAFERASVARAAEATARRAADRPAAEGAAEPELVEDAVPAVEVASVPSDQRATERAEVASQPSRDAPPTISLTPSEAQRLIGSDDAERALAAARAAIDRGDASPGWRAVEADALRALRRYGEAADAYDAVAAATTSGERAGAGFRAALLRRTELADSRAALASLDRAQVDAPGSPLEERGLALRARCLVDLDRRTEAREVARGYLARFPGGTTASFFSALVAEESAAPEATPTD